MRIATARATLTTTFYGLGSLYLLLLLLNALRERPSQVSSADETQELKVTAPPITEAHAPSHASLTRKKMAQRKNMAPCDHPFGKVKVFIAYRTGAYDKNYGIAKASLDCYLRTTDYELVLVDLDADERVVAHCSKHRDRHCALLQYLNETDWMLVMDADTGVVNPEHCIEEFIDERVHLIFYERFFNWEITVKNSAYGRKFILDWSQWEFNRPKIPFGNSDNCVLHMQVLQEVLNDTAPSAPQLCDRVWKKTLGYASYLLFVFCTKVMLGAERMFPGKLKIEPRVHGIARDSFLTNDKFFENDFLLHGWKHNDIGHGGWESPFEKPPEVAVCDVSTLNGWHWRNKSRISRAAMRTMLVNLDRRFGGEVANASRHFPWNIGSEIEDCFPECNRA